MTKTLGCLGYKRGYGWILVIILPSCIRDYNKPLVLSYKNRWELFFGNLFSARWWFQILSYVHPYLGKMNPF